MKLCGCGCKSLVKNNFVSGHNARLRKKIEIYKDCKECGKEFIFGFNRIQTAKWCSYKCYWKSEERADVMRKNRKTVSYWKNKKRPDISKLMRENHPMKKEENRAKMRGDKNPNYRGGICDRLLKSDWIKIRFKILKRDTFTCQNCGKNGEEVLLDVHHKIPYRICRKDELHNLITICRSCHSRITFIEEQNSFRLMTIEKTKKTLII